MINLILLNTVAFQLDTAILPRHFQTTLNRSNKIILRNIRTGYRVNLGSLDNVTIEGSPATFEGIRKLVYNFSCSCTGDDESPNFKIFDVTFNYVFE